MANSGRVFINSSGLSVEEKASLRVDVQNLGGVYEENLTFYTTALITNTVLSNKYKFARNLGLKILAIEWIEESKRQNEFVRYTDYELPVFKGLSFGVIGFGTNDYKQIEEILTQNGATVKIIDITSLDQHSSTEPANSWNIALLDLNNYKKYENIISKFSCPLTSIEWIQDCILAKEFNWPNKHLINKEFNVKVNKQNKKFNLTNEELDKMMNSVECTSKQFQYLKDSVFYFPKNIDDNTLKYQKRLVVFGGGSY